MGGWGGGFKGVSGGRAHLPITQQIGVYTESKESHKGKKIKAGHLLFQSQMEQTGIMSLRAFF